MRVIDWIGKVVDGFRRPEPFEKPSPRVRVLAFLFFFFSGAMTLWGLLGWSLNKSWPDDIVVGFSGVLYVWLVDRKRARRDAESELHR
jgi:hypothetical protein